jgi:hypothetical protein
VLGAASAQAACPPEGTSRESLAALKSQRWAVSDPSVRARLADALLACLGEPDPWLRDSVAFEALQHWMRTDQLDAPQLLAMRNTLLDWLSPTAVDAPGFRQPFAALVLAEVARVDRMKPYLSVAQRDELVRRGAAYLEGVRDYRGFHERDGWRHGVAHGADLLLQLSLNARLDDAQRERIVQAVWSQVVPDGAHFYRYGEPERLMAPVFHVARRAAFDAGRWTAWFMALAEPSASAGPVSDAALARRHNVAAFLQALYVSVQEGGDAVLRERLMPGLSKAIKTLP